MAKSTVKTFKHTVWKSCSLYVRLREADTDGNVRCVTCGKRMHIHDEDCQAGHFIPGRGNEVLFDDALIFPQCSGCNYKGGGEQARFGMFLKKRYGYDDAALEEILMRRHKITKFTMDELKAKKETYDRAIAELKNEKGIE